MMRAYDRVEEVTTRGNRFLSKKNLVDFLSSFVEKMYENNFKALKNNYLIKENRIVFNRGNGAESNFFVFLDVEKNNINIFFTNPSEGHDGNILKKDEIIINYNYDGVLGPRISDEYANSILKFSRMKKENEYRCYLHSHLGYVGENALWGDGITKDKNWIEQTMFWHGDYHALTEHNWTQNEEVLNSLKENLESVGITFIPGWENTTTIEDEIKSPHILVLCADINTAMMAKYEFLSKKLENRSGVTPILCGAPGPFEAHLNYLKKLHDMKKAAIIIAHPASKLPGIDILDPNNIRVLGKEKIFDVMFKFGDGVEQYNFGENHDELDFDLTDGKIDGKSEFADELREELRKRELSPYLSPPMVNYLIGLKAIENGKIATVGQDDHFEPPVDNNSVGDYGKGYTKFKIPEVIFEKMKVEKRKPSSAEFVNSIITKSLEGKEVSFEAVAFATMTEKGPKTCESRTPSFVDKTLNWMKSKPEYYLRIAKLQFKFWAADEKQKEEIAKELEKAKAYKLKP